MAFTEEQVLNFLSRIVLPSALAAIGQYLRKRLIKDASENSDLLGEVGAIISQMQEIIEETPVERFLIFRMEHNKKPPTTSVVFEVFKNPIESVYSAYQELEFDTEYTALITQIKSDKMVSLSTAELHDESILKRIYKAENIKHSCVFLLINTKKYLYYASIATTSNKAILATAASKNKVGLAKEKIKRVLVKHKNQIGD